MMLGKKAMFNILVALIMVLAAGLVIGGIGYQLQKKLSSADEVERCRMSIFANAQAGKMGEGGESFVRFDCPRLVNRIRLSDVERRGRIDDERMKSILADEMRACWAMVGKGKQDPFDVWRTETENFCLVCKDIIFDNDLVEAAEEQGYNIDGFPLFMVTEDLRRTGKPLYDFVKNEEASDELIGQIQSSAREAGFRMNMDRRYSVVWRVMKSEIGWDSFVGIGWQERMGSFIITEWMNEDQGWLILPSRDENGEQTGLGVGLGTTMRDDTFSSIYQQVLLLPEDELGRPFEIEGTEYEFCTRMIN